MSKRVYVFTILGCFGKTYVYHTDDKKEARKIFDDWTKLKGVVKSGVKTRIGFSRFDVRHISIIIDNRMEEDQNGICK